MDAKKRVLIVDDEQTMIDLLRKRIETEYDVIVASDGHEGLDKARAERPDLILADVMMPRLDGYHMCRLLKFDEKYKDIPIIMLTSRIHGQDRKNAEDVKADAYITKPFKGEDLMGKIRGLIG